MIFGHSVKRSTMTVAGLSVLALVLGANTILAQQNQEKYKFNADEGKIIKKLQDGKTFQAKMQAAGEFVKKFPNSAGRRQIAEHMATEVEKAGAASLAANVSAYNAVFNTPEESDLLAPMLIDNYLKTKDYENAFKTAEGYLKRDQLDSTVRLQLAVEGSNLARSGEGAYIEPSIQYAGEFIALVEGGKRHASIDDQKWKEYQTQWLPTAYESRGILYQQSSRIEEARKDFDKAIAVNPAQINSTILVAIMVDDEYQALARKHMAANGAEKDALLKQANTKLDEAIELLARAVAVTDGNNGAAQINGQLRETLTAYYKYRHNSSTDGLQTLIDKYKSKK